MLKGAIVSLALISQLITPKLFYAKETSNIDSEKLVFKLAEIDSKIDEIIIKNNLNIKIDLSEINSELEKILLNSKKIDKKYARLIWMYSGKIYIKINKLYNQNSKDFRLAPSDTQTQSLDILKDAKKIFVTSKWIYIISKDKKKSN